LNFLYKANLGYDSKNLVRVDIPVSKTSDPLPSLFKSELIGKRNILSVAARNGGRSISGVYADDKVVEIENIKVDDQFLTTFKIPIVAGRNFSPEYPSDSLHAVIVNESFLKEAGWTVETAVGKAVKFIDENRPSATIVGVVKDYHYVSLKEKIKPALFSMYPPFNFGEIWVKINPDDVPQTLTLIEQSFKKLVPYFPYNYQFMDEVNARQYKTEAKWRQIIMIASGLFIFISCIGLFGLVILSIEQRTKEIGIRKVLGATVMRIAGLISRQFIGLVCLAFVVSVPLAYLALDKWLQKFAYHINMQWSLFVFAGVSVVAISLLVVGLQAMKAGMASPVKNLRTE
jgi:putative ABC transport system permease protein